MAATETNVCVSCGEAHPLAEEVEIGDGRSWFMILCPRCIPDAEHEWGVAMAEEDDAARERADDLKVMEALGK